MDDMFRRLNVLVERFEKIRIDAFLCYAANWKRRLMADFFSGIVRGIGFSIGFSLLSALILFLLKNAALTNLPVFGRFLAELVRIVELNLK